MIGADAQPVRWLTEQDVREVLDVPAAIAALSEVLPLERTGDAENASKSLATWGETHSAHSLLATAPAHGRASMKNWVNVPAGASAVLALFDTDTGQLRALMRAAFLGAMRTAGTTGLATSLLAPEEAASLAILGAGRQARFQVQGVAAVRDLRTVHVWNRGADGAARLAAELAEDLPDVAVHIHDSIRAACQDAAIVVTATRAAEPFVQADDLPEVVLIHAMGAILPANAELTPDVVASASRLVVDSPSNARTSRELADAFDRPPPGVERVELLGDLVAARGAPPVAGRTIVKAMGTGLADLAVATSVLRLADARHVGAVLSG